MEVLVSDKIDDRALSSGPMIGVDYRVLVERVVLQKWRKATPNGVPRSDIRVVLS